jgi:hypothetical protein
MPVTKNWIDFEIDRKQVYHYVGYESDDKPSARISSLIDEYIENAHQLLEPSYSYVVKDIERIQDSLVFIEDSITFESQVIAQMLEECQKVAVFLVTIGDYLEEAICWLAEHKLILQALVLDSIGSAAAERVADFVQGKIREAASAQGLVISQRFSPGYCDWDIGQQKELFRIMKGDLVGIHLTEECLMLPRKSVSGIIGIGPGNGNVENYNPCKTCNKYDCLNRR